MTTIEKALKIVVLWLSLSIAWTPFYAQNYIYLLRVEYASSPGNAFESGPGTTDVNEWALDANVPIVLSEKHTLLTGLRFENVNVSLYPNEEQQSLYGLSLKLGVNTEYSDKWSATYLFLPKLASDLKVINGEDFQFGVAALFKHTKNQNLNFKFGAFYNTERFGPFIVPLAGVYYQQGKWEFNILAPRRVDINYQLATPLKLGLKFNGSIVSFNLNTAKNDKQQYLNKANNVISAYLGWSLGKLMVQGVVGHSIGRQYRAYEQNDQLGLGISAIKIGDDRTQLNTDFSDGIILNMALIYRFELNDE